MPRHTRDTGLVDELQRSHRFTFGVLASVLLLSLLTSGYLILVSQPRITGYVDLARDARDVQEAMLDQETGLRGWLATGQTTFLEPYRSGTRDGAAAVHELVAHIDGSSQLTAPVVATLLARQRWEEWADRAVTTEFTGAQRAGYALTRLLQEGKRLFDAYRVAYAQAVVLIQNLRSRALSLQSGTLGLVLALYVTGVGACGALTLRRRRHLRQAVLQPIEDLHGTVMALRSGDLSARATPTTVPELRDIGQELERLSDDLARAGQEAAVRETTLQLAATRFETLVRVGREIAGSLSVRYVAATVTTAASELLGAPTQLWIRDSEQTFRVAHRRDEAGDTTGLVDVAAPDVVVKVAAEASAQSDGPVRAHPLVLGGRVTAVLEVRASEVDPSAEQVLTALLSTAAAALESAHLHSSAREQADKDALTGLLNRRRFEVDADDEWERCRRYGRPVSMVMLDLDHFKRLNDQHGHLVGDHALRAAAAAIGGALRTTDTAYRYGGEEFVVLLRETSLEEATVAADRLRLAIAAVTLPDRPTLSVTVSAGVASRRSEMGHHSDLVAQADLALYRAKRLGRNRVASTDDLGGTDLEAIAS